ncbi:MULTISPECIES: hypothetical protein [unclassified Spirosoma]|mgnify:CR=1 FL=1|uniref:hypothetical protein n=1 Tax=unclassified Spirosoma TaxID=2621999 RepID=UPI00095DD699|nr:MULTISPECIES: hypothetical protein [unclassified Spirosoma]MBN8822256.1 hypothetical protein [Spirosoma sp.]OJW72431.1 MAG: hypothetical protein BGO59_14970 [Spirosoma sp. 48-14]
MFRPTLIELFWLALAFAISVLICLAIFGRSLVGGSVDIQLYDTYFVLSSAWVVFPLFLIVSFLLFLVKEGRIRFSRTLPNLIILVLGLLLVILFSRMSVAITKLWTSVSVLPSPDQPTPLEDPFVVIMTNSLIGLQVAVTLALVLVGFYWGKRRG